MRASLFHGLIYPRAYPVTTWGPCPKDAEISSRAKPATVELGKYKLLWQYNLSCRFGVMFWFLGLYALFYFEMHV
jgi:hypothetical protein